MFEPEMHYIRFLFITASPPALCAGAYGGAYYGFAAGMGIAASRLLPCRFIVSSPVDNRTSDYLLPPKGACPACLSWSYPPQWATFHP